MKKFRGVTKKDVERILLRQANLLVKDYVTNDLMCGISIRIDDAFLSKYVETANILYPDKTEVELVESTPPTLTKSARKLINNAISAIDLEVTL